MAVHDLPTAVAAQLPAAEQVMQRADTLAKLSASAEHIERVYLSPEHQAANEQVGTWMQAAGLDTHVDAVGSIVGQRDLGTPRLVIGSHLDTIPNAGRYDGILGVLCGIEIAAQLTDLSQSLEVIGFGEEEGVRFGTTLIASRGRAGTWDPAWWQCRDAQGTSLGEAMQAFGLQPDHVAHACPDQPVQAYLELHIEQGPVLESLNLPVGVVTGIAGNQRMRAVVAGTASHAGTVPMHLRRDAAVGAAECVNITRTLAVEMGVVATVGQLQAFPGGVNVIPGRAEFSLDVRSTDDAAVEQYVATWRQRTAAAMQALDLQLQLDPYHQAAAVQCAPHLQRAIHQAISQLDLESHALPSGAGHDAMAMASLCDVGMIFVRCKDGLSHHPDELVDVVDVAWGLAALRGSVEHIAQQNQ